MSKKRKTEIYVNPNQDIIDKIVADAMDIYAEKKDEIMDSIENTLIKEKPILQAFLSFLARNLYNETTVHYDIDFSNCDWDMSGEIYPNGYINIDESLNDYFDEKIGTREPTFQRRHGWNYRTISDHLSEKTRDIGWGPIDVEVDALINDVSDNIDHSVYSEAFFYVHDKTFDELYDNTSAGNYFSAEGVLLGMDMFKTTARELFEISTPFLTWLETDNKYSDVDLYEWENFKKLYLLFSEQNKEPQANK